MDQAKKKIKFSGLHSEMAKYGDTQATLAKVLGLSTSVISRKLAGKVEWTIGEIEAVCAYYKKDYYELFIN